LNYLKIPLLASVVIVLLDSLVLDLLLGSVSRITFVLVLFLEGSLGLITGAGVAISSTPSISKLGEITIGSAPWSREGEKNAGKVAAKWIISSALIILTGFALSIL
jgi:hypothetical protein